MQWDAIVLAGGRATRMGGRDKAGVEIDGRSLLTRTLDAVSRATRIVVVGPGPVPEGVVLTREQPPYGGPVAALAAGLDHVGADWTLVAACDHPFLSGAVARLVAERGTADGAVLESAGYRQLAMIVRTSALRSAVDRLPQVDGASVRTLFDGLDLRPVLVDDRSSFDIDTPADLTYAKGLST